MPKRPSVTGCTTGLAALLLGCSGAACTGAAPSGSSPAIELAAVVEAARTGGPEAEVVLRDALESDDPAVRMMAATAVSRQAPDRPRSER